MADARSRVRVPGKARQVLSAVEGKERLRMFRADMGEEGSFDDAVRGCVALLHVAASMELHVSPDQHDVGKPRLTCSVLVTNLVDQKDASEKALRN